MHYRTPFLVTIACLLTAFLPVLAKDQSKTATGQNAHHEQIAAAPVHRLFPPQVVSNSLPGIAQAISTGNLDIEVEHNQLRLPGEGELVIQADKDLSLTTSGGMILLQKGSVAQITSNSWCLKVRNLYDRHSGAIRVHVEDRFLDLDTGQEAVLADNQDLLRYVIVSDLIGRRRMRIFTFSSGTAVLFGEFQPQGVMLRSPVFRALRKSNKGAERAIFKNCLKMSACLAHATASHGNYVLVGK